MCPGLQHYVCRCDYELAQAYDEGVLYLLWAQWNKVDLCTYYLRLLPALTSLHLLYWNTVCLHCLTTLRRPLPWAPPSA